MAPPLYSISPPHAGYMRSNMIPHMPLPPPHPFVYRNARVWPQVPRIVRPQNPPIRSKKIICIRDPQTGQDVTEEILSSATSDMAAKRSQSAPHVSPPIKCNGRRISPPMATSMPIPMGFMRKPPTTPQVILKCFHDEDYLSNDEMDRGMSWPRRNIFTDGLAGCSWPPTAGPWLNSGIWAPPRNLGTSFFGASRSPSKVYSREQLMLLQFDSLSLIEPSGLKNWEIFKPFDKKIENTKSQNPSAEVSKPVATCSRCGKAKLTMDPAPNKTHSSAPKTSSSAKNKHANKKSSGTKKDIKNKELTKSDDKLARGDHSFEDTKLEE